MSRRTIADMDAELLLRTANRTDITTTMRAFFLNDAYLKIANEFVHSQLQGLTTLTLLAAASSASPTVTDVWWPDLVKDSTHETLLDPEDKERIVNAALQSGNPSRFYWYGDVFYFDRKPVADTTIQVWYTKKPADIAFISHDHMIGTEESVLDEIFDPLIIMNAAQLAFETCREFAEAHIQEVVANNYVARQKLPLRQAKLNDHRTGIRLRTR